ncbi:MAG: 6,7-dimethyl-8-ribityllumazine synthase [Gemmatimonadota bacterium]
MPRFDNIVVAILVSRFHEEITEPLLQGALETVREAGLGEENVHVFHVAGAWELPMAGRRAAATGRYDALVALGCVVRGETPHFDYVAGEAARGLARVALEQGVPVGFGLLTTDDEEQARARSVAGPGNKGREAALAALESVLTLRAIDNGQPGP